jgi:hypothetical protein
VIRVLQSSDHVRGAQRSDDGTLIAELVIAGDIDRPWHPDPKAPTRFAVLSARANGGETEFTLRVSWVAGAKPSAGFQQYVEDTLASLQASIIEKCSRDAATGPKPDDDEAFTEKNAQHPGREASHARKP